MSWRFGLLGYPLSHSLSPRLHQAALAELGLEGDYQLIPIPPGQDDRALQLILEQLRHGDWDGLNVTIPHKTRVLPLVDRCSSSVQALGAANTLVCRAGSLWAENTDLPAFTAELKRCWPESNPPVARKQALILGAGGAARAAAAALLQADWEVTVAARRVEQAQALARALAGLGVIRPLALQASPAFQRCAQGINLLVNATPVGMWPDVQRSPWPESIALPAQARVIDLIYNPPETRFLRQARQAGLLAWNGLGMLVEQAALALEHWLTARGENMEEKVTHLQRIQRIRRAMQQAAQEFSATAVDLWGQA